MPKNHDQTLGERVRKLREQRGWSQQQLAEQVVGVKQQSIDQVERGLVARPRFLGELADIFGVREEWLRTGAGAIKRARGDGIDEELLSEVLMTLEPMLLHERMQLDARAKADLIRVVCKFVAAEPEVTRSLIESVAAGIIAYERLRQRRES